jgi:transcriptional antiterminator NusG
MVLEIITPKDALMAMRWYVLSTMTSREESSRELLLSRFRQSPLAAKLGQTLIPVEKVTEVKRGKKVTVKRKLFPGYIYIELEISPEVIELVNDVDGIIGFLGDREHPAALSKDEADRIIAIANAADEAQQRAAIVVVPYKEGDKVKIKEGTFSGLEGQIEAINHQKGLLKVMITVFGRQTPVELEVWQVEELT